METFNLEYIIHNKAFWFRGKNNSVGCFVNTLRLWLSNMKEDYSISNMEQLEV